MDWIQYTADAAIFVALIMLWRANRRHQHAISSPPITPSARERVSERSCVLRDPKGQQVWPASGVSHDLVAAKQARRQRLQEGAVHLWIDGVNRH